MNFVIDMNLSPTWVDVFARHGWTAVHWTAVGDPRATDRTILAWAVAHDAVVFTHDLDFGAILAATGARVCSRYAPMTSCPSTSVPPSSRPSASSPTFWLPVPSSPSTPAPPASAFCRSSADHTPQGRADPIPRS